MFEVFIMYQNSSRDSELLFKLEIYRSTAKKMQIVLTTDEDKRKQQIN